MSGNVLYEKTRRQIQCHSLTYKWWRREKNRLRWKGFYFDETVKRAFLNRMKSIWMGNRQWKSEDRCLDRHWYDDRTSSSGPSVEEVKSARVVVVERRVLMNRRREISPVCWGEIVSPEYLRCKHSDSMDKHNNHLPCRDERGWSGSMSLENHRSDLWQWSNGWNQCSISSDRTSRFAHIPMDDEHKPIDRVRFSTD